VDRLEDDGREVRANVSGMESLKKKQKMLQVWRSEQQRPGDRNNVLSHDQEPV
jgi:hypothetical protein